MKPFARLSVALLSVLALLQLVRLIAGWTVVVAGVVVPLWLSAVLALVAGLLAVMLWRESRGRG